MRGFSWLHLHTAAAAPHLLPAGCAAAGCRGSPGCAPSAAAAAAVASKQVRLLVTLPGCQQAAAHQQQVSEAQREHC